MKKVALLAMAAVAVVAMHAPGSASASWTKHHAPTVFGENIELELTGTDILFKGEEGGSLIGFTCKSMIFTVLLEGGTTTGRVTSFGVEPETNCTGRGIQEQCTVSDFTADNLPWTIHTKSPEPIAIPTGTITYTTTGFFCQHTLTLTPSTMELSTFEGQGNTTSTGIMSGTFNGDTPTQTLQVVGTFHVLGTITYGLGLGSSTTSWTKHHEKTAEEPELELTGTDVLIQGTKGGITCHSMTAKVRLEPSSKGTLKTFEPESKSKCTGTGPFVGCTVTAVTADNLPWSITTYSFDSVSIETGTITGTLTGAGCPGTPSWTSGTIFMSVAAGETTTTSTTSLSGELTGDNPSQSAQISGTMHVLGTITYGI